MKNLAPWARKVFDEPRVGFVAEHGSQRHPLAKPLELAEPLPSPGPSPLDKIIDEDRLGFAEAQRADQARRTAIVAQLRRRGRKPRSA
jgi:hypothetical protein